MRGFAKLRELNWVALGAEVLLIFVGITLALWFENANEARRQWDRETGLLGELATALDADIDDIRANLREDSLTLASIAVVLRHLDDRLPYADSLDPHFAQAAGITIFIHNASAYEHLKVAGLDLVRDAELRQAIIHYYERRVQVVRDWETWVALPAWQEHMNPQMLRKFRYTQRKVPAPPLDYAALLDDIEYHNVLRHSSFAPPPEGCLLQAAHRGFRIAQRPDPGRPPATDVTP